MMAMAGDGDDERDDVETRESDDPVMASMRSVWLSMRDEEPSSAGLSGLLAAARAQAEAIQERRLPWWRRAWLAARRPPVLAFASVAVLLGGALWITGRRENFDAAPVVSTASERVPAEARGSSFEPSSAEAPSPETAIDRPAQERGAAPVLPEPRDLTAAPAPSSDGASSARPRVRVQAETTESRRPRARGGSGREGAEQAVPTAAPPPSSADSIAVGRFDDQATAGGQTVAIPNDQGKPEAANKADRSDSVSTALRDTRPAAKGAPGGAFSSHADQPTALLGQLSSAAERGDCTAVRDLVARLTRLDAEVARAQIARSAAVRRCLE
ncbi:MAG: hypothetical protein ACTHU0_17625 [Kofleriaceae bacterium]